MPHTLLCLLSLSTPSLTYNHFCCINESNDTFCESIFKEKLLFYSFKPTFMDPIIFLQYLQMEKHCDLLYVLRPG